MIEEFPAAGDFASADGVREETVMTDPNEATRKHMEEKAFEKLQRAQGHELFLVPVGAVLPTERDLVVLHRDESFVGKGDPVRVAAEVVDDLVRPGHGRLSFNADIQRRHQPLLWSEAEGPGADGAIIVGI